MEGQEHAQYAIDVVTASMERTIRRLWILCVLLAVFLVCSNAAWIWYESQWEDIVTTEIQQDTGDGNGANYIVGGDFNGPSTG